MGAYRDLKRFIRDPETTIRFAWINKRTFGLFNYEDDTVTINLILSVADTLVHEYLHSRYPNLSERRVVARTTQTIDRLTVPEIHRLAIDLMRVRGARSERRTKKRRKQNG